ncbi:hypothetical protein [Mesorhizobium sp.]|uniref:hypothetical protein n=1 Tax=Mesorhizobium sp. TaxID=1871066 RepID=UPI0025F1DB38|nr:hypothetical protein [Mesorhizobium sp.]
MADLPALGLALILVGIVFWTIGGMISFRTDYDVHNRHMLGNSVQPNDVWRAFFSNPKSRWWCVIGLSLLGVGAGLLLL